MRGGGGGASLITQHEAQYGCCFHFYGGVSIALV